MVQIDVPARVGISVGCRQNTTRAELQCFLLAQVVAVFGIEYTVGERLTGTDAEEVARHTCAIAIDVVQRWAFLGRHTCAHGTLHRLAKIEGSVLRRHIPCLIPFPCTSKRGSRESWTRLRQKCGACGGVRADGIAYLDMRASIGSPTAAYQ